MQKVLCFRMHVNHRIVFLGLNCLVVVRYFCFVCVCVGGGGDAETLHVHRNCYLSRFCAQQFCAEVSKQFFFNNKHKGLPVPFLCRHRGGEVWFPPIHNPQTGTRRRWVVSTTLRLLYPLQKRNNNLVPLYRRPVWMMQKISGRQDLIPRLSSS